MFRRKSSTTSQGVAVVLTLFALLLSGCRSAATPTATPPPPPVTLVVNPDITDVFVGDTVALTVETGGQNLGFKWSAARGRLSAFDTPAVIYTAPNTAGVDTVTVEVSSDSGTTTKNASFNVVFPPPPTPTPTPTGTATPTPTDTPTPTATPSPSPTAPPTIMIATPLTTVVCPLDDDCRFSVTGTSSGVVPDPNLKVVVFVNPDSDWADQWWPHKEFSVNADGTWQGYARIGHEACWSIGDDFEIVAIVMPQERAASVTADFQYLPEEYVAQSNVVDLVTTYDPVPIDLSSASASYDTGSSVTLSAIGQTSLTIDYDLGTGAWVQVPVPVKQDMSCMKELGFSVTFSLQGTGAANSLEVKLEDGDGTNFGWLSMPGATVTDNGEMIEAPLDDFEYWWGNEGMDWQRVANVIFAVSKKQVGDAGGVGQVIISDVVMMPPVTP